MTIIPRRQNDIKTKRPFVSDVATIPLTQGYSALIDEKHLPLVSLHQWFYAEVNKNVAYPMTNIQTDIGQTSDGQTDRRTKSGRTTLTLHRYLWECVHGPIPSGMVLDHINGDTLDNRLSNLRVVSYRLNALNNKRRREGLTSSRYGGVTVQKRSGKYVSTIGVNGKRIYLGTFTDELSAHKAYIEYANSLNEGVLYG